MIWMMTVRERIEILNQGIYAHRLHGLTQIDCYAIRACLRQSIRVNPCNL